MADAIIEGRQGEDDVEEATFAAENKSADSMEEIVEAVEGNNDTNTDAK